MSPMAVTPDNLGTRQVGAGWPEASVLDSPDVHNRLDREDPRERPGGLAEQFEAGWLAASAVPLPPFFARPERVVVLGAAESGIGGLLLQALAADLSAPTPVIDVRDHTLPPIVDRRTLVLVCTTSESMAELASTLHDAVGTRIPCAVISAGGQLVQTARELRIPAVTRGWGGDPGRALGWNLGAMLAICARCGVLSRTARDLPRALDAVRVMRAGLEPHIPEARNEAKQMARRMAGRLPLVAGTRVLGPVAHRWRTQIGDHARSWAIADGSPEDLHGRGLELAEEVVPLLHAVFLRHPSMSEHTRMRVDELPAALRSRGATTEVLQIPGPSVLAQTLCAIQFGDFVSYYLALVSDFDGQPADRAAQPRVRGAGFGAEGLKPAEAVRVGAARAASAVAA